MKTLQDATVEELEAALEAKRNEAPRMNGNPDISPLKDLVSNLMAEHARHGEFRSKDFEQHLYETVFETFYGPDVFKWMNARTKQVRGR
jgi:hypothetical protein